MSLSRSSSQMLGKNPLRLLTLNQSNSSQQQEAESKDQSTSYKPVLFNLSLHQKGEQYNAVSAQKNSEKKVSVSFQDSDIQARGSTFDQMSKLKGGILQRDSNQHTKSQKIQNSTEVNDVNKSVVSNSSTNLKQNEKKFDDKANIEYKKLFDMLCEENSLKQKKVQQLKNIYQSSSIVIQEKEKDPIPEGIKLKGIKGLINLGGEKSEDIIQRTITQKKSELESMENQIQEQIMYNQTLNFMALRTDTTLKDQKKLVLKMEKLNKIVDKRAQDYNQILQEHYSQQQLTQFKMAEQVAQIINKEEIYKSIDQSRMKQKKTQNEDFQKITQEQEEISRQIAILKERVQEQANLITELDQVATNVTNLKMSFPYTFQKAEAMLYVAYVFASAYIENILGDLFYVGVKENKSIIMDSYLKLPFQANTTNNTPASKRQLKENQNKQFKGSLNSININLEDKKQTRYEYRHQVSNSFHQSSMIMKDNYLFIRLLEILKKKETKGTKDFQYGPYLQSTQIKSDKNSVKKGRASMFIKKKLSITTSCELQTHKNDSKTPSSFRKTINNIEYQQQNQIKINFSTIGERQYNLVLKAKDRFLNSTRRFNPNYPDFEYRFLLRELTQLDSKSNGYMSALEARIQKYQEQYNVKIDDQICRMFQEMTNNFIQLRSMVSLKIQEKNMKFEKNKALKKKIFLLQQQIQKKYEISEESMQSSNYYISEFLAQDKELDENESYDWENEGQQNSSQTLNEREQRSIRLMNLSKTASRSNTTSPIKKKDLGDGGAFNDFDEIEMDREDNNQQIKKIQKEFQTDFNSMNILNSKLETIKYTNLHILSDNRQNNNNTNPFESSFVILEKTLGVVKRILQLMNTCLTLTQDYIYDDIDSFRDLAQAFQQFNYFNNKMLDFLHQQEGRFFGSYKFNHNNSQLKQKYSGGINSLIKQFKLIFPTNLVCAQKMFHSLIAHDVVVINFLDMDQVDSILRDIKQQFDQACMQFINRFQESQGLDLLYYQNGKTISWNGQTLVDVQLPQKEYNDKLQKYAQKCLEVQLMGMIQNSSKLIIEQAYEQCQDTTKNLFDLCTELYLIIFQILTKRNQLIEIAKSKKETQSLQISTVLDQRFQLESSTSKLNEEKLKSPLNLNIKIPNQSESRKHSQISISSSTSRQSERKSIMKSNEIDNQARKNIFSVFSKALKDKKKQTKEREQDKEKSPNKQKADNFFIINEEGAKEQGSNTFIQEFEFQNKENENKLIPRECQNQLSLLNEKKEEKQFFSQPVEDLQCDMSISERNNESSLNSIQLEKSYTIQSEQYSPKIKQASKLQKDEQQQYQTKQDKLQNEQSARKRAFTEQSENSIDLNCPLLNKSQLQTSQILNISMQSKQQKERDQFQKQQDQQELSNESQIQKNNFYERPFRQSGYQNFGSSNPFQISLYKNRSGALRSEEESRILISSLAYYKNKEKTINKVIQKKQIESGEIYDSFHSSLLTVDLKTKQSSNLNEIQSKKLVGFISNQVLELQNEGNDVNLVKEAQYFEEERKQIKQQIQEEMKYYVPPPPPPPLPSVPKENAVERNTATSSEKISFFIKNSSFRKTNNSLNNSLIGSQSIQSPRQTSNSPSQLPSILKSVSPSHQLTQESKVRVVKFPTVGIKKGVVFKDFPKSEKSLEEFRKQNQSEQLNSRIISNGSLQKSNQQSPTNFESKRNYVIRQYFNKGQNSEQVSLNQSMTQDNSIQYRGRCKPIGGLLNIENKQNDSEKIYQQYSPERFREEEVVLDEYKKTFLHLDQVYKATIQASKEKLEQIRNNPSENSEISQLDLNQDTLRRLQDLKKGQKFFKIFKNKLELNEEGFHKRSLIRQQSDESLKDRNSSFFRTIEEVNQDRRSKSKLTKILPLFDQQDTVVNKQHKPKKQNKKLNTQNHIKKQNKASQNTSENKGSSKKKNSKKKNQQINEQNEQITADIIVKRKSSTSQEGSLHEFNQQENS